MIWAIFFYYIWIFIVLFCLYLMCKCCYKDREYTKKATYPVLLYIAICIGALVPGVNFFIGIFLVYYICIMQYERDLYVKHWLFKKL